MERGLAKKFASNILSANCRRAYRPLCIRVSFSVFSDIECFDIAVNPDDDVFRIHSCRFRFLVIWIIISDKLGFKRFARI